MFCLFYLNQFIFDTGVLYDDLRRRRWRGSWRLRWCLGLLGARRANANVFSGLFDNDGLLCLTQIIPAMRESRHFFLELKNFILWKICCSRTDNWFSKIQFIFILRLYAICRIQCPPWWRHRRLSFCLQEAWWSWPFQLTFYSLWVAELRILVV